MTRAYITHKNQYNFSLWQCIAERVAITCENHTENCLQFFLFVVVKMLLTGQISGEIGIATHQFLLLRSRDKLPCASANLR